MSNKTYNCANECIKKYECEKIPAGIDRDICKMEKSICIQEICKYTFLESFIPNEVPIKIRNSIDSATS